MVMEGDLHWGGEHTVWCTDNVMWDCAPEICIFLLTSVTPINSINRKKKEFCLLQGHKDTLPCFLYSLLKVSFQTLNFPHWLCCHLFFFLYSCGTRKITLLHCQFYILESVSTLNHHCHYIFNLCVPSIPQERHLSLNVGCVKKESLRKTLELLAILLPLSLLRFLCVFIVYCLSSMSIQTPQNHTELKPCFP